MNIIEVNNLTFRYGKKFIYDKFNLNIEQGTWVTVAGPNGSGKSTLVKILAGLEKNYANIKMFNKDLNKKNLFSIRKEIGFVFDNPENYFACETVEDELAFSLENIAVQPATIKKKIDEISKLLDIKDILKENPYNLSGGQKQKVQLGCALMLEPRMLILDEALNMIDIVERKRIHEILKDYNKRKRVTIVSFTHNLDESLYSDRLVILNEGKVVIDGAFPHVYNEERVMRKIGLEVPFEIELSQKLRVFGLSSEIELDLGKLVNQVWK